MEQNDPSMPEPDNLGLKPDKLLEFADRTGMPRSVDQEALLNFALSIAESCAEIGDRYTIDGRNCGDEIRAKFGLG